MIEKEKANGKRSLQVVRRKQFVVSSLLQAMQIRNIAKSIYRRKSVKKLFEVCNPEVKSFKNHCVLESHGIRESQ